MLLESSEKVSETEVVVEDGENNIGNKMEIGAVAHVMAEDSDEVTKVSKMKQSGVEGDYKLQAEAYRGVKSDTDFDRVEVKEVLDECNGKTNNLLSKEGENKASWIKENRVVISYNERVRSCYENLSRKDLFHVP